VVAGWSIFSVGGVDDPISLAAAAFVPAGIAAGLVFRTAVALISERFPGQETQQLSFIKVF
jgi:hypothetical protein